MTKLLTDSASLKKLNKISGFQLRMYVYYYHNIRPVN